MPVVNKAGIKFELKVLAQSVQVKGRVTGEILIAHEAGYHTLFGKTPVAFQETIKIKMALNATSMPSTIPRSISFHVYPRANPTTAATILARIRGRCGGPSKARI